MGCTGSAQPGGDRLENIASQLAHDPKKAAQRSGAEPAVVGRGAPGVLPPPAAPGRQPPDELLMYASNGAEKLAGPKLMSDGPHPEEKLQTDIKILRQMDDVQFRIQDIEEGIKLREARDSYSEEQVTELAGRLGEAEASIGGISVLEQRLVDLGTAVERRLEELCGEVDQRLHELEQRPPDLPGFSGGKDFRGPPDAYLDRDRSSCGSRTPHDDMFEETALADAASRALVAAQHAELAGRVAWLEAAAADAARRWDIVDRQITDVNRMIIPKVDALERFAMRASEAQPGIGPWERGPPPDGLGPPVGGGRSADHSSAGSGPPGGQVPWDPAVHSRGPSGTVRVDGRSQGGASKGSAASKRSCLSGKERWTCLGGGILDTRREDDDLGPGAPVSRQRDADSRELAPDSRQRDPEHRRITTDRREVPIDRRELRRPGPT